MDFTPNNTRSWLIKCGVFLAICLPIMVFLFYKSFWEKRPAKYDSSPASEIRNEVEAEDTYIEKCETCGLPAYASQLTEYNSTIMCFDCIKKEVLSKIDSEDFELIQHVKSIDKFYYNSSGTCIICKNDFYDFEGVYVHNDFICSKCIENTDELYDAIDLYIKAQSK